MSTIRLLNPSQSKWSEVTFWKDVQPTIVNKSDYIENVHKALVSSDWTKKVV